MSNEMKREVSVKCRAYYLKGVNINYSFETLEHLATDLGAKLMENDVLVVDNQNGDKRKMYKKTRSGAVIIYAHLEKDIFTEMPKITRNRGALEFFDYAK